MKVRTGSRPAIGTLAAGILFCVCPLLPFDHQEGPTVNELSTLTWPGAGFTLGLGIVAAVAGLLALFVSEPRRKWALGVAVIPLVTAIDVHAVHIAQLLLVSGERLADFSYGLWFIAIAVVAATVTTISAINRSFAASGKNLAPAGRWTVSGPWTAVLISGGILQEWFVDPLAVTGNSLMPYGAHRPASDVYGALAYFAPGAVMPQAMAGAGLAIVLALTVLACGSGTPGAAGLVAGAAAVATVDTLARFAELAHPLPSTADRGLPLAATVATTAFLATLAVFKYLGTITQRSSDEDGPPAHHTQRVSAAQ